jgi:DNA-binding NtrC family response regulator
VVARALHGWSGRSGALVPVHCAALEPGHALFAGGNAPGLLASANGGTVLLDQVAELAPALQSQLLLVIDRGQLPGQEPRPIDVRFVATSQEPLARAVGEGRLRPELHARLEGIACEIPPLRSRIEDVPALFAHFARLHGGGRVPATTPGLIEKMCLYDYPYNVRELQGLVRRLLLEHAHVPPLRSSYLPEHVRTPSRFRAGRRSDESTRLQRLIGALREHEGSVARASSATGMTVAEVYDVMDGRDEGDT